MVISNNRRKFARLPLSDDAVAVDDAGQELGKVSETSGSGMLIAAHSPKIADSLPIGRQLRVTIVETNQSSTTIDIAVRRRDRELIGVEFVTGKPKA